MRLTLQLPEPVGRELLRLPDRDTFVSSTLAKALEERRRTDQDSRDLAHPRTGRRLDPSEVRKLKIPPTRDREREIAWRQAHLDELQSRFAGQWVVLEGEEVVAADRDAAVAVEKARAQGVGIPYVFYVEPSRPGVVHLGL